MHAITDSMSNLDLVKIEESALTLPLPKKLPTPLLTPINKSYVEMDPLMILSPEPATIADTEERLAGTDTVMITDNVCYSTSSDPPHRFRPRFRFTKAVIKSMKHLNCTNNPAHD